MGTAVDSVADTGVNAQHATYVQGQKGAGILSGHVQRDRMIDAILKGESAQSISRWVSPPVSRITIGLLAKQVREQQQAARLVAEVAKIKEFAISGVQNVDDTDRLTKAALIGSEHLARIKAHQERIDRNLVLAEAESDRNSLAALIKTDLQGVRLAAELDGSLQVNAVTQNVTNMAVLVMPNTATDQPVLAPAIDTTGESFD